MSDYTFNIGLGKNFGHADINHPEGKKRSNMGVWQTIENPVRKSKDCVREHKFKNIKNNNNRL